MDHLDDRVAALFGPERGKTEDDKELQLLEMAQLTKEIDEILLEGKKAHVDRRDHDSAPGKLGDEFEELACNPNVTAADKIKFVQRVHQAIEDLQSDALASTSGDMISELYRDFAQSAKFFAWLIQNPNDEEVLDFASKKRIMRFHPLDWCIGTLEDAARLRKFPAVPAPMNTFSRDQINRDGPNIYSGNAKPHLDRFLATGPWGWHCADDLFENGIMARATSGTVCSLDGHKDCLLVKVVEYEGSNAFDFCYSNEN